MGDRMSEDKSTVIKLVAVERGFANGRMVEPGQSFEFDSVNADGKTRKLPKWATTAEKYKAKPKKPVAGDLKPKDVQAAVKQKASLLSGEQA